METTNEKLFTTTTQIETKQHFSLVKISNKTKQSIASLHREALELLFIKRKTDLL